MSDSEDSDAPAALTATDASFGYPGVTILDAASVELQAGDLTALVGPNGSGKTTVLELFAGLRALDAGTVTRPPASDRAVAYLPQRPGFRSGFDAREALGFYADLVDADVDPDALLARVGLGEFADRRVEALSGGMVRLLGIAQALVGDPPVVALDEPTSGLDPDLADHIFDVAEDIVADDRVVLLTSHDLAAIEARADRVLLLSGGEFVLDGAPDSVLDATGAETLRQAFSVAVTGESRAAVGQPAPTGGDD